MSKAVVSTRIRLARNLKEYPFPIRLSADKAREIGTYDISIQPYEDCCTVFLPKHPVTKPKKERIERSESALDVETLVKNAVESEEIVEIRP